LSTGIAPARGITAEAQNTGRVNDPYGFHVGRVEAKQWVFPGCSRRLLLAALDVGGLPCGVPQVETEGSGKGPE
jgi:hypothetical protein